VLGLMRGMMEKIAFTGAEDASVRAHSTLIAGSRIMGSP